MLDSPPVFYDALQSYFIWDTVYLRENMQGECDQVREEESEVMHHTYLFDGKDSVGLLGKLQLMGY